MSNANVTNNEAQSRYELAAGEEIAFAVYDLDGKSVRFSHTEVPEAVEGQGVGSRLIAGALDDVWARGLKVVPSCAFVRHYIEIHPEMTDLLA